MCLEEEEAETSSHLKTCPEKRAESETKNEKRVFVWDERKANLQINCISGKECNYVLTEKDT